MRVLQADVRAADDRLAAERDRTDLLQRHLADARRGVVDRRDEVTSLRAALESLDRDKDAMTADADERAETIARHEADAVAQVGGARNYHGYTRTGVKSLFIISR